MNAVSPQSLFDFQDLPSIWDLVQNQLLQGSNQCGFGSLKTNSIEFCPSLICREGSICLPHVQSKKTWSREFGETQSLGHLMSFAELYHWFTADCILIPDLNCRYSKTWESVRKISDGAFKKLKTNFARCRFRQSAREAAEWIIMAWFWPAQIDDTGQWPYESLWAIHCKPTSWTLEISLPELLGSPRFFRKWWVGHPIIAWLYNILTW